MSKHFKLVMFYYMPLMCFVSYFMGSSVLVTLFLGVYGILSIKGVRVPNQSFAFLMLMIVLTVALLIRDIIKGWSYYESPTRLIGYLMIYFYVPCLLALDTRRFRLKINTWEKVLVFVILPFIVYVFLVKQYQSLFLREIGNERLISPSAFSLYILYLGVIIYYIDRRVFSLLAFPYLFLIFATGTRLSLFLWLVLYAFHIRARLVLFLPLMLFGIQKVIELFKGELNLRAINFSVSIQDESRFRIYVEAIQNIKSSFFLGSGWYLPRVDGYVHNIFLELIQIGGVFWFILWLVFILDLMDFRIDRKVGGLLLFVPLMFTGSWHTWYYLVPMLVFISNSKYEIVSGTE